MKRLSEIRLRENFKVIHYIPLESAIPSFPGAARALVQACNRLQFRCNFYDLEALLQWENDGAVATYEEGVDLSEAEKGRLSVDLKRHREICEEVRKAWNERLKQFIIMAKAMEEMAQSGAIKLTSHNQNP